MSVEEFRRRMRLRACWSAVLGMLLGAVGLWCWCRARRVCW
ncbi:hypothetical protein [Micromonospora andamanensis]|nr:hypothetical protein [Micromonospora andamanensis]